MPFQSVLGEPAKKRMSPKEVGCEFCPLNKIPGIHKVMGEVHGREVFIWGMAPGPNENDEREQFVGKSGKLLWQELKRVGITRDMCDIQNVVRCFPADRGEDSFPALRMRDPTKEEIHCCSVYTKRAIERSQAKVDIPVCRSAFISRVRLRDGSVEIPRFRVGRREGGGACYKHTSRPHAANYQVLHSFGIAIRWFGLLREELAFQ